MATRKQAVRRPARAQGKTAEAGLIAASALRNPPSKMELREHCPGSAAISAVTPKEPQSPEAEKGERMHQAIQGAVLEWATEGFSAAQQEERISAYCRVNGITDPYDRETVAVGVRILEAQIQAASDALEVTPTVKVEVDVPLAPAGYHGRARLDVVVQFGRDVVMVVEIKTGAVEVMGPVGNRQLHDYAVGARVLYPEATTYIGTILQPGLVTALQWREARWTGAAVDQLAERLRQIREATFDPNAPFNPGSHCSTCPASQMCPARRGTVTEALKVYEANGKTVADYMEKLEPGQRAEVYQQARKAASYLKKFDELVKAWAVNTKGSIPGFKIASGRGQRRFIGRAEAAEKVWALVGHRLKEAKLAEAPGDLLEMVSPAKIEEVVSETEVVALQPLIEKEAGAMTLVEDKATAMPKPRKPA